MDTLAGKSKAELELLLLQLLHKEVPAPAEPAAPVEPAAPAKLQAATPARPNTTHTPTAKP